MSGLSKTSGPEPENTPDEPNRRRWLTSCAAGSAMLACAVLANRWHPVSQARPDFQLDALIPSAFGAWRLDGSVTPVQPTPDVQANLDKLYGQIVSRTYINGLGERMMLVVAYGGDQSDSLKAHRQEVCYSAQGFTVRALHRDVLKLPEGEVPLIRMHAVKGMRSEPVSYWFTMGEQVVIDRVDRLVVQVGQGLAGRIPDGMLVRVSSLSKDLPASYAAQDDFVRSLLASLSPAARRQVAGTG